MNWGKGIAIFMAMFMVFIIILTGLKLSKVNDLEFEDYYAREIKYEDEIQAERNALELGKAEIKESDTHLIINIPLDVDVENVNVSLRRPNDKKLDREFIFENTKTVLIDKDELVQGIYKIEVLYAIDDVVCLIKDEINI